MLAVKCFHLPLGDGSHSGGEQQEEAAHTDAPPHGGPTHTGQDDVVEEGDK